MPASNPVVSLNREISRRHIITVNQLKNPEKFKFQVSR